MSDRVLTPMDVEQELRRLNVMIDTAHAEFEVAERSYQDAKADFEIGMARARMVLVDAAVKTTVQERDDSALIDNDEARRVLGRAEALAKVARANSARLYAKSDIVRSIGALVRTGMSAS